MVKDGAKTPVVESNGEGEANLGTTSNLTPAAQRALAEAAERRRLAGQPDAGQREVNGRGGAEPVRFGDWEVKGLAVDF